MSSFLKNLFGQASNGEPESGKKVNHVVVDIEITEHEYMAFDADDEMVGGESFVFNGDDSPGFIRITVDGNEIKFDEDDLCDRSKYSDYEPFDMEEKWNSEDIVKFGYYDNLAGRTWEFDVEDFDINKLSFYYQCFDVNFSPADYESEEHRLTLRYDGKEIEEDYNAYSCDNGEFEQEWYMYDDDDDESYPEDEDEDEDESPESDLEAASKVFGILAYTIANIDDEVAEEEMNTILQASKAMNLDFDIVRQRVIMEAKGERDYESQATLLPLVIEGAREPMFNALTRIAISDCKLSQNELAFLSGVSEIWGIAEERANAIINYHIEKFSELNPDCNLEIEEEQEEQSSDAENIFSDTDTLWSAVIEKLPEDIKANVSASAGKAYIHIKPKSKHLGVKDFKYCVEYSKTKARAYVNVETLNGGVEGKTAIQNYIDSHNANCIVKSVVPQQGVKNKDKWKWEVTTPATELNPELTQWYVDTITAFWNFFEE